MQSYVRVSYQHPGTYHIRKGKPVPLELLHANPQLHHLALKTESIKVVQFKNNSYFDDVHRAWMALMACLPSVPSFSILSTSPARNRRRRRQRVRYIYLFNLMNFQN